MTMVRFIKNIILLVGMLLMNLVGVGQTYSYNFDDGTLQGWENITVNNDGGVWLHSDNNPGEYDYTDLGHSGDGFAMSYSFIDYDGAYDTENYLKSPQQYNISQSSTLNFWYDYANDSYPDYFEVCISTSANPTESSFTAIWNVNSNKKVNTNIDCRYHRVRYNNWRHVTIDLSSYAGQSIWIAFHHVDYDMYEIWIDDIEINVPIMILNHNIEGSIGCGNTYTFYDSGGESGNYQNGENYTATFTSDGNIIINFSYWDRKTMNSHWDYMTIYDGTSSGTQIGYGDTEGPTNMPTNQDIIATSGIMTIVWHSDGSAVTSGWKATVTADCSTPQPTGICEPLGNNDNTNGYIPSYSLYDYSLTQQIYTVDEIGQDAGTLSYISFYSTNTGVEREFNIFIKSTDKTTFESTSDWVIVNSSDLVFSGNVTFIANTWTNIYLDTPFEYDGNSNILLVINDISGHWESTVNFNVFNTTSSQAIRIYRDGTVYDPFNPSQYSGTLLNVKNQIKLCTEEGWTLPINLLEFYATPDHLTLTPTNNIYIKTGGEWNNCEYIIYRSSDAINWDYDNPVIDWDFSDNPHDASSNANYSENSYMEYFPIDYNPYDTTYYKLIQRDCDNTAHEYTSEIIVCINTHQKKSAWDYFSYTYEGLMVTSNDKPITIICYNILGQMIYQTDILSNDNIILTIKPPYIVTIYEDGTPVATEKVFR